MGPWPNSWTRGIDPAPTTSPEEGPWTWLSVTQAQQRAWAQWMQAGQTWLQWWATSLPSMPWPPAGVVVPPADVTAPGGRLDPAPTGATLAAAHARDSGPAQARHRLTPKSKGARHH